MQDEIFPTEFARTQGEKNGLTLKLKHCVNRFEYSRRITMLQDFQTMALATNFEDCLVVFYDLKLSKKRLKCLKVIYEHTRVWMRGYPATVLLQRLQSCNVTAIDAKYIASALVECLQVADGRCRLLSDSF